MTIEKTLTIPKATRHLTIDLPQTVPAGTVNVVLSFPTPATDQKTADQSVFSPRPDVPGEDDEDGLNLHPTAEQIAEAMAAIGKVRFPPSYATLEEAIAEADRRAEAAEADPSLYSLKEFHGIWKDSKAWGQDVDVEAEIRKMRDSKKDYWGTGEQGFDNGKT
ncbi:hypothetical protein FACS189485_19480 [Spirochaetia bacterium]|nr:hypothetical protein FACS189485_19480 [Spirochaetia bacterium]